MPAGQPSPEGPPIELTAVTEAELRGPGAVKSKLRGRPEPKIQILGRVIGALVLLLNNKPDEAGRELHWVAQFISGGTFQLQDWDYRDLQPMALKIAGPPRPGIPGMVHSLFGALTGKIPIPQFTEDWKKVAPAA